MEAFQNLKCYIRWYNEERTRSALNGQTPKSVFES
ncbi:IS3 family transposase [Parapedobacter defluvii]